jgi:hypothetical protein
MASKLFFAKKNIYEHGSMDDVRVYITRVCSMSETLPLSVHETGARRSAAGRMRSQTC